MLITNKNNVQYLYIRNHFYEISGLYPYESIIKVEYRYLLLSNMGNIYNFKFEHEKLIPVLIFDSRKYGKFIKIIGPHNDIEKLKDAFVIYENYYIYMHYKFNTIESIKKVYIKEKILDACIDSKGYIILITNNSFITYHYNNLSFSSLRKNNFYLFERIIHEDEINTDIFNHIVKLEKRNNNEIHELHELYKNMSACDFYIYLWEQNIVKLYSNNKYIYEETLDSSIINVKDNIFVTEKSVYIHYGKKFTKVVEMQDIVIIDNYKNFVFIVTSDNRFILYELISVLLNEKFEYIPIMIFENKIENYYNVIFNRITNMRIYISVYTKTHYCHINYNENSYSKISMTKIDLSNINACFDT